MRTRLITWRNIAAVAVRFCLFSSPVLSLSFTSCYDQNGTFNSRIFLRYLHLVFAAPKSSEQQRLKKDLLRKQCGGVNQSLVNLNKIDLNNFIVDDKHGIIYCYIPKVACTNWKRTLIALNHDEPYPDPINALKILKYRIDHYTKFLFVRDPFVRLISAYRDKMQKYDQYFYDGYVRVILQRFTNQRNLTVNYNVARKKGLRPSFYNFIQYIVDPRTQTYAFEPHWSQMYRLCHPCLIEYDFVGHQESLQEDAQELLKMVKLENDIKFPPSSENMTSPDSVMDWFQSVPLQDRRKLYKIYEEDFQLFGYRRPTELLDD
uniref:Carbohydrate sulfotransferase n=1 Tax=Oryzias latipes TaxID=8090 RepID=A0A3P9HL05_ORYLA